MACEGTTTLMVGGWDAGSERNTERCPDIPARCPQPTPQGTCSVGRSPEGFVHVHAGIQGCANFPAEVYDWRHPVARIEIAASSEMSAPAALEAACPSPSPTGPAATPADPEPTPESYQPLEGWRVSEGSVRFLIYVSGSCMPIASRTISGVAYTIHSSRWQSRAGPEAEWSDIPGTEREGDICPHSPSEPGQYRSVAEITIGSDRGHFSSENILAVP